MMDYDTLSLKGGDYHITENEEHAYRVEQGAVLVFIVPYNGEKPGRRSFIYEAHPGEVIPGFSFRDIDYAHWRFCLMALEQAELSIMENAVTKALRRRFCGKIGITELEREGYHNALVEKYRLNIVAEDSLIRRTNNNRETASRDVAELIAGAFRSDRDREDGSKTRSPLYDAVQVLCKKSRIPLAPYEKVLEASGSDFEPEDIARISHFACREVTLEPGWHKTDCGPLLVYDKKGTPRACFRKGVGYKLYLPERGGFVPVKDSVAAELSPRAYMLYRPLPARALQAKDVVKFCLRSVRKRDMLLLSALTAITAVMGLLTPRVSQFFFDWLIPLGASAAMFQIGSLLLTFLLANLLFLLVRNLTVYRITGKMACDLQEAVYHRLFNLPESFFRSYDSADLAHRVMGVNFLAESVGSSLLTLGMSLVYLVTFFIRMLTYSVPLALLGTSMALLYGAGYGILSWLIARQETETAETEGTAQSVLYQFLSGISKIRIAGVEDRALLEYFRPYVRLRNTESRMGRLRGVSRTLQLAAGGVFTLGIFSFTMLLHPEISAGSFLAFGALFSIFIAVFNQMLRAGVRLVKARPKMARMRPVLAECPEIDDAKSLPGDLTGEIEINNVTFAYGADSPNVLDDISLTIRAGEYVGIVGSSGCGKSTLLRLLLGFETPTSGKIYYDSKDIESLDKRELRKKMGVVLQDGSLISGSIFENITVTAPKATMEEVEDVIRAVGLEQDIREMPMGLHTLLSEDGEAVSGGQQQRILIARALLSRPGILFFDEATSSLDNVTQKTVTETIGGLRATRVVIAHRLSTVMHCDRILVMDDGKIAEQGSYVELMHKKGMFYRLANRQIS